MSNSLGEAVLDLAADSAGLISNINSARPQALSALQAIGVAGGALLAAGIMAAATAVVAITALIWSSANTLDAAYDNIQTRTGAAGAELEGLKADFEAVFTSVPTDAQTASDAIGILNSTLGVSGPVLQDITANVLEFSRLTGTDAAVNAQTFAQLIGNWKIPVDQAAGSLDTLFVIAQNTGTPIDQLMQQMVASGPVLQQYGIGFDQAAQMLAGMTQFGLPAESAMMGLKTAAAGFAAEGVDLATGLQKTVDAIKGAKSPTEALNIAVETFGERAAPAMLSAIQSGEWDAMVAPLGNTEDAIMNTAEATMDWGERLTMFKNKITTQFAPAGQKLMDVATKIMAVIADVFERPDVQAAIQAIATWIGEMAEKGAAYLPVIVDAFFQFVSFLQNNQGVVIAILAAIGVAIATFVYTTVIPAALAAITALAPILLIMAAVAAVAYLVYQAWTNNWGGIQTKLTTLWGQLQPVFAAIKQWLEINIPIALQTLSTFWTTVLLPAIQAVWTWLSGTLFPFLSAVANLIGTVLGLAVRILAGLWTNVLWPALRKVIDWMETKLMPVIKPIADFFKDKFVKALEAVKKIIEGVTSAINKLIEKLKEVELPDFLTPGSPTPFETGLRGIHAALLDLNRFSLPAFATSLQFSPAAASMGSAGAAAGGAGTVTNIYLYGLKMEGAGPETTMSDIMNYLNQRR